jgi:prophage antirepressor-like protein
MNSVTVFGFGENKVEVIELNGQPLFNARDVGAVLGIADVNSTTREWTEKQAVKLTNSILQDLHNRKLHNTGEKFLTESGVYKLIMRSSKPDAEKFQDWIAEEVLPSIRKNGGYIANQENLSPEQIIANALIVAHNIINEKQKQLEEAIRTKAEIGSRREATAMNTASQKSKEVKRLEIQLDSSKDYATVRKVQIVCGIEANWRELKKESISLGLDIHTVPDELYGSVKSYHKEVWQNCYGIDITSY